MTAVIEVLKLIWLTAGTAAAVITLPGSIELLALTIGNLLPGRRFTMSAKTAEHFRIAVVIPAHNEEASITASLQSLQRAEHPFGEISLVVVADNCTDHTAEAARNGGARVLIRNDAKLRGKGYALDYAFHILLGEGYDALLIVDADTEVAPNFLAETGKLLLAGADAVQCRYLVRNPKSSTRTRLMNLALRAFNVVRPRGRDHLGLSCGIGGNGFGMRRETLEAVPYTAASVVEDLEYHLLLVRSGRRVRFASHTTVYGDMPAQGKGVETQRVRWEGGRFRMIREKTPGLLRDVLHGHFSSFEPLLELLLLPLAFHVTLLAVASSTLWLPARMVGLTGLFLVLVHLVEAIFLGGSWHDVIALITAPFYVLWKLLLIPKLLRSSQAKTAWVRTERTAEKRIP